MRKIKIIRIFCYDDTLWRITDRADYLLDTILKGLLYPYSFTITKKNSASSKTIYPFKIERIYNSYLKITFKCSKDMDYIKEFLRNVAELFINDKKIIIFVSHSHNYAIHRINNYIEDYV